MHRKYLLRLRLSLGLTFASTALLCLTACGAMEQRPDMPPKKTLSAITAAPVRVHAKWEADTGGVGRQDIKLSAARAADRLYTADAKGNIRAIASDNGTLIWAKNVQQPISAGPAVGEGKIAVGTTTGKVIALDLQGNVLWTSNASSEILAAPQITRDMVLIHTMDGGLTAFSAVDGRQLWRFTHNLPTLMLRRSSTPIVVNDKIIAGFANGKLLLMRKQDGTVEWSYDVAHPKGRSDLQRIGDISADPVIKNGAIYAVSYQGNLVAIRVDNGQLLWERDLGSFAGFAVDDRLVYLADNTGNIYALDAFSGDTFWMQNALEGRRLCCPAIMGDRIIIGDEDGNVHWLAKTDGARLAGYKLDSKGIEATPVIHNDVAYILGRSGKLVALEVR